MTVLSIAVVTKITILGCIIIIISIIGIPTSLTVSSWNTQWGRFAIHARDSNNRNTHASVHNLPCISEISYGGAGVNGINVTGEQTGTILHTWGPVSRCGGVCTPTLFDANRHEGEIGRGICCDGALSAVIERDIGDKPMDGVNTIFT